MAKYRDHLPQLGGGLFLTDGGLETTLIFHEGLTLPDFAAFDLFKTPEGEAVIRKYFLSYAEIAQRYGTGLILESATWRASPDWGERLGYTEQTLADANCTAIEQLQQIRQSHESDATAIVISGCLGPRGDGYLPDHTMSVPQAQEYHSWQIDTLAGTVADMVCAMTMNYANEAIGVARAAQRAQMPLALSFTVEADGLLPTGQALREAIEQVDQATSGYPCYYMINCAHPTHFARVVEQGGPWLDRIWGIRANASRKSHAQLNESTELDSGNPAELGAQYAKLIGQLPRLHVMGGCCGTDQRHVEQIALACSPAFRLAR
jgi:S-methylmethionine-dependent homocysteine/selenocysteine methylase